VMDRIGAARRVTDKGVSWSVGKTPSGREAVYDFDRATKVVGQPIPMSRSQAGVHRRRRNSASRPTRPRLDGAIASPYFSSPFFW